MADSINMRPAWACNICFEESRDPVCTSCGHLFCWPCLYTWTHDRAKSCPVCRSSLHPSGSIIPVYVATGGDLEPPQLQPAAAAAAAVPIIPAIIPPRPRPPSALPTTWAGVQLYRDTMRRVWRQEAIERARLTRADEGIAQLQRLVYNDSRSLSGMRRYVNVLTRNMNAAMNRSQTSTSNAQTSGSGDRAHLDRPVHDVDDLRRVLDAVIRRRRTLS